ncbi:hypothetical protein [Pseudarthrobacter sp. SSS035]|uniref:hypothetical protein n=1 Tax=Pseudarthrobacter sp. SSS035 TaxID=2931399 RepID=UPI00200D4565|nr:hypothetical protein [Pseudarthrobacter sp. SSS035]
MQFLRAGLAGICRRTSPAGAVVDSGSNDWRHTGARLPCGADYGHCDGKSDGARTGHVVGRSNSAQPGSERHRVRSAGINS